MLTTKLLLIEGLPGSGKTSFAKQLSKQLDQNGIASRCYLEDTSPNPALAPWDDDPEAFLQSSIDNWIKFAQEAADSDWTTIIEGIFFQSTPRLLLQQDLDQARIQAYILQVEKILRNLNPVLIYLQQADIASAIREICAQRGAQFQSYFVRAVTENPYGRQRGLKGLEGAIAFMQAYRKLSDTTFEKLGMKKLRVAIQNKDWEGCYREVYGFLDLGSG